MVSAPASAGLQNRQANTPLLGKFEGVGKKVLEDLLHALGVGNQTGAEIGVQIGFKRKPAVVGFMTEGPCYDFQQACEEDFFRLDGNRAGFDLGEIENVADEIE